MTMRGSCHCGNASFELTWDPEPAQVPARACGCTFCVKHGGVWTSNPAGRLDVLIRDKEQVSVYAFGTRTADFHVCSRCGVVPVVTSRLDGRLYAVVNVNALEGIEASRVKKAPMDFEGESLEARLARRRKNWIAEVAFRS
jgi:hypothetical protein